MLCLVTKNKPIWFLLSCLVFKILKGDFNDDVEHWSLSEDGPEAHYLKLLYNRNLNFKLVKTLFTQTVLPPVCDVIIEEKIIFKAPIVDPNGQKLGGCYWKKLQR